MVLANFRKSKPAPAADGRGSGRISYRVWLGGYEDLLNDAGQVCDRGFILESAVVEIEDSFMGFNDRPQLEAWVTANHPDKVLMDWQQVS